MSLFDTGPALMLAVFTGTEVSVEDDEDEVSTPLNVCTGGAGATPAPALIAAANSMLHVLICKIIY